MARAGKSRKRAAGAARTRRPSRGSALAAASDAPPSEPEKVDAFVRGLRAPHRAMVQALREIILGAGGNIGEHIKWGHPAFFYAGPMRPFPPKEHRRHMVVFNLHSKQGGVLLVFVRAAGLEDASGLLAGDYADGRRLARFQDMKDVEAGAKPLRRVVEAWLDRVDA